MRTGIYKAEVTLEDLVISERDIVIDPEIRKRHRMRERLKAEKAEVKRLEKRIAYLMIGIRATKQYLKTN